MDDITWDKSVMREKSGRLLTQSLFLELGYRTEFAVFTLNEEDKEYQGKLYPSIKKWYLKVADPTEYAFANKCFANWNHWVRITENKAIQPYVEDWRAELDVALRSEGVLQIMSQAEDNHQAAKWLAEKGWDKKEVGRPKKIDKEREKRIKDAVTKGFEDNIVRMEKFGG